MSKEHNQGFIEAVGSGESSLPLISFFDVNVVVPPSYIYLREVFCSFQFIDEGGDEWEWVCVFDSMLIEIPVILAGVEASILLLDK